MSISWMSSFCESGIDDSGNVYVILVWKDTNIPIGQWVDIWSSCNPDETRYVTSGNEVMYEWDDTLDAYVCACKFIGLYANCGYKWTIRNLGGLSTSQLTKNTVDDGNPAHASSSYPYFWPTVTDQRSYNPSTGMQLTVDSCVANALATMMQILIYRQASAFQRPSIAWIYGNRAAYHWQQEAMMYSEALDMLSAEGVPPYTIIADNENYWSTNSWTYGDVRAYTNPNGTFTAKQIVDRSKSVALSYCSTIYGYDADLNTYYIDGVKEAVYYYGGCILPIQDWSGIEPGSSGYCPIAASGTQYMDHTLVIMGWKRYNGVDYWICQNSWGSSSGDDGIWYVPFKANWIYSFFALYPGTMNTTALPTPVLDSTLTIKTDTSITVGWTKTFPGTSFMIECWDSTRTTLIEATEAPSGTNTFYNLSPNTTYSFKAKRVDAYGGLTNSSWSNWADATTTGVSRLTTPLINSSATVKTTHTLHVEWYTVPNAVSYVIEIYRDADGTLVQSSSGLGTPSRDWSGLAANTAYRVRCQAHADGVVYQDSLWSTWSYATTDPLPLLETPIIDSSQTVKTTTSITFGWYNVSGADRYDMELYLNGSLVVAASNYTSPTATFYNLAPNTTYQAKCRAKDTTGIYDNSLWSTFADATTLPAVKLATPALDESRTVKGSTTLTFGWYAVPNATLYDVYIWKVGQTFGTYYNNLPAPIVTATWLTPNTQYGFRCFADTTNPGFLPSDWSYDSFATTLDNVPTAFAWTYPKVAGSVLQFSAAEWNALIDKVIAVYGWKGWSLTSYPMTKVVPGLFYAARFNEVNNAISSKNVTGISSKNSKDKLYAWELNALRDKLNQIIVGGQ